MKLLSSSPRKAHVLISLLLHFEKKNDLVNLREGFAYPALF